MIGHAIVHVIANQETIDGTTTIFPLQKLKIEGLSGETVSQIQRVQEYGLETYPAVDHSSDGDGYPEAVAVFINGNRDQGIVICVGDRRYRITDLAEGEVALYTKWNEESGEHSIKLKTGQEIEMNGLTLDINISNDVTVDSANVTITCSGDVDINCETANVSATTGVNLDGGTAALTGVVTGASICPFTGNVHSDTSTNVKASK